MEEVKGDILRLLKTRGKKTGDGEQTSCCVVCGAGINLLGTEELSGEKVGVVLQALLVDQKNEAGAEDTNNGRLEACWQCSKSLRTLIDLFNQLEDSRERFNDLRRLIGRQVILGSLGRPEESFARWMEEVKSVEDVYPSRAIRRLRKIKVGNEEAVVKVEWNAEDFEFCVEPVNDHLDKADGIIGDINDHLQVSEFVIYPNGCTREDSPRKDVKLTKMRPVVVLNRSFGFGIVSAKPASKNGKPVKKTVQVNMNEIKSKDNKPETDLSRSARRPPIKSPTFSTEEKRKRSIPRKILEETIRTHSNSEVQRGQRFESFEYGNGNSLSKGDVEVFGSENKSRRFGKRQRLDDTLENSKPQSGKDKEDINDGPFEEQDDEFRPSDNNDSDEESEESSDAECTPVKLNRPRIRKPDKRVRKRIRTSGTTTKKQCLLCDKAFDRPWRLRLHIEEFHSGVPKKTSRRKNHTGRIRTAQKAQDVGSDSRIEEKEFTCSHCDLTFRNLKRLSSHQLQTHWLGSEVPGSLQCRYCMKFFLEETPLIAHLAKTHKTVQTETSDGDVESQGPSEDGLKLKKQSPVHIQCFQCKTTFSTVEELEVHAGTKEHQETLKSKVTVHCNVCRLKLRSGPTALQDHLTSETHLEELKTLGDYNNDTFCVPCRLDLGSHEGLMAHNKLTVHRRKCIFRKNYPQDGERLEVPDKCHLCGGTFNFARSLENHMKVSHKEGGYTCEICGKNFILLRDFKSHRKRHGAPKPFVCEVCGKEFIDERNLRQHAERFHLGEKSICAVCGKEFPSRATLEAHEASVHFPSRRKSFTCQCTFCPEVFKKPVILRRHLYEGHREEYLKETPYACLVCFHLFPTSEALESHSASHEELKCPTCGKGFRYKIFLDNHLRAHTGEKPFACTQCDKKFSYSSGLKEHMLGHNEKRKRPFICSCGTGFVRNRSLKLHKDKTGH